MNADVRDTVGIIGVVVMFLGFVWFSLQESKGNGSEYWSIKCYSGGVEYLSETSKSKPSNDYDLYFVNGAGEPTYTSGNCITKLVQK